MYKTCKKECNLKMGSPLCVFACVAYEMAMVIYASNWFILCKGTGSKPLA